MCGAPNRSHSQTGPKVHTVNLPKSGCACIKNFCCGLGGGLSRTKNRSGTRCAHQFWPQGARSAASALARSQRNGRLPARAHASNRNRRAHPGRSQNSDRACTQSVGFMHARVDGRPRMRWNGVDCQDAAGRSIALRNLLSANSSARGG